MRVLGPPGLAGHARAIRLRVFLSEEYNQWYQMSQSSCVRYTYSHLLAVSVPLLFSQLLSSASQACGLRYALLRNPGRGGLNTKRCSTVDVTLFRRWCHTIGS